MKIFWGNVVLFLYVTNLKKKPLPIKWLLEEKESCLSVFSMLHAVLKIVAFNLVCGSLTCLRFIFIVYFYDPKHDFYM